MSNELEKKNPQAVNVAHQFMGTVSGGNFAGGDIHYTNNNNYSDITRTTLPLGFKQCHDYYFVLSCHFDDDNLFLLRKDPINIFTEDFTNDEVREFYINNKEEIFRTPALVSKLGDPEHLYYGFIRGYKNEENICNLKFFLLCELPMNVILENSDKLNIWKKDLKNEFTYNSWSIKKGNINLKLNEIGISLPEF